MTKLVMHSSIHTDLLEHKSLQNLIRSETGKVALAMEWPKDDFWKETLPKLRNDNADYIIENFVDPTAKYRESHKLLLRAIARLNSDGLLQSVFPLTPEKVDEGQISPYVLAPGLLLLNREIAERIVFESSFYKAVESTPLLVTQYQAGFDRSNPILADGINEILVNTQPPDVLVSYVGQLHAVVLYRLFRSKGYKTRIVEGPNFEYVKKNISLTAEAALESEGINLNDTQANDMPLSLVRAALYWKCKQLKGIDIVKEIDVIKEIKSIQEAKEKFMSYQKTFTGLLKTQKSLSAKGVVFNIWNGF